jgi:ferredoxin--NADP+ reductase
MLRTYRHEDRWEKLVLIHGVRRARDLGYREELEQIQREDDRVTYIPICSDEPEGTDWKGLRGRVDMTLNEQLFKELAGFPLNPKDTHLFLCGNPAMITTVQQSFEKRGFVTSTKNELGNIHFERYW